MGPERNCRLEGDRELLDGFRRGDHSALEQVYWAYVAPVERLVRGCLACLASDRSRALASVEDLVQDVFARAFSRNARVAYDGLRDYGPYLFAIARNVVADALRISGREVLTDQAELSDQTALEDSGTTDEDASTWADRSTLIRVRDYVTRLSPDLRALHHQRYVLGMSQLAAADALGISRQQFRTLESKLRAGLRRELASARTTKTSTSFAASPVVKRT